MSLRKKENCSKIKVNQVLNKNLRENSVDKVAILRLGLASMKSYQQDKIVLVPRRAWCNIYIKTEKLIVRQNT